MAKARAMTISINQLKQWWRHLAYVQALFVGVLLMLVVFFQRTAGSLLLALGLHVLVLIAAVGMAWMLNPARRAALHARFARRLPLLGWAAAALTPVLLALTQSSLTVFFAVLGVWLFLLTVDAERRFQPRRVRLLIGVGAALLIGARLFALESTPEIHRTDEGWALGMVVDYARSGRYNDLLMDVPLPSNAWLDTILSRAIALPGLFLRLVGEGYWQMRAFSFAVNMVTLAITAWVAREWYGRAVGWLTAAVLLGSGTYLTMNNTRIDCLYTFTTLAAIALTTMGFGQRKLWLHMVSGVVVGAGVFAHFHAVLFGVAVGSALYLLPYLAALRSAQGGRRWLPQAEMWAFGLGAAVAAVGAVLVIVVPDPEAFRRALSIRGYVPETLLPLWTGYFTAQFNWSPVEALLVLTALVALGVRRRREDVRLLTLIGLIYVALLAIAPLGYEQYIRPLAPLQAMAVAALLLRGFRAFTANADAPLSLSHAVGVTLVALVLIVHTLFPVWAHLQRYGQMHIPPPPAVAWLRANVPPQTRLLLPTEYYLWMTDYPEFRSLYLEALQNRQLQLNLDPTVIWNAVEAEYIVYDPTQREDMTWDSLFASDYLRTGGYRVVAEIPYADTTILIYQRAP
ncbi:MAG: glycosyltransferase family 39 protein [Chloroflexi bacterium]|nr:glycosyltransferase family 39 protein [Chloroflexota bacterium]